MNRVLSSASILFFLLAAGTAAAKPKPQLKPISLVLSPASTVPTADILKNLRLKCPNASITLDSRKSNYMLEAGGWSGNYKFTVFKPGGQAVFGTSTRLLSNAVKNVCKFINSRTP